MELDKDLAASFRNEPYLAINDARLDHLASILATLEPVAGLSVLELGAGIGDHTQFWLDRGCRVTTSDARPIIVEQLKSRYPDLDVRRIDLDLDIASEEQFDIVYCYGILYHLRDPARGLDYVAAAARSMVFIETCVSFGDEQSIHSVAESAEFTQSAHAVGCRPTRPWVFDELGRRFDHVYQPDVQPDHPQFPLDWDDPASAQTDLTRTTFIASRAPLTAPRLFPRLLNRQVAFKEGRPDAILRDD